MADGPDDLEAIPEDYSIPINNITIGPEIGHGTFGRVFKGTYSGLQVAIKKIPKKFSKNGEFEHEVKMLKIVPILTLLNRSLRHPNIVLFMGVSETEDDYFLVVEFVRGGSLCKILMDLNIELSWGSRIRMAVDIAVAMLYLHNKNCIHRDLKSENILVEPSESTEDGFGRCKVSDFGLSRLFTKDGKPMSEVGTCWWKAPEVSTLHYDQSADVFSFGVLLLELIIRGDGEDIRLAMTYQKSKKELIFLVDPELLRKQFKTQLDQCPPPFFKLAGECVNYEPSLRPKTSYITDELLKLHNSMQDFDAYVRKKLKSYLNQTSTPIFTKGYKFWMRHATGRFDYEFKNIKVPFKAITDDISQHLQAKAGRGLDQKELEFFSSVIGVELESAITLAEFCEFWAWYWPTEHLIRHPGVMPLYRDGFIHGFIGNSLATKWIVDLKREDTFVMRFSTTKPGCLVITCYHNSRPTHLLVQVDDKNGFVLGNIKYNSIQDMLSKSNLDILKFVYPNEDITSDKFEQAFKDVDAMSKLMESNSKTSTYDVDLEESMKQLSNYVNEFQNELNQKLKMQQHNLTPVKPEKVRKINTSANSSAVGHDPAYDFFPTPRGDSGPLKPDNEKS